MYGMENKVKMTVKTVEVKYSTVKMNLKWGTLNYRCAGFTSLSVGCNGYLIKAEAIFTEILKQFLILALEL